MANTKTLNGGREKLGSRLGFILISAGCAIGLGNVWRFPYIVGQYGGAAFIILYLIFLVIFGLPIMTMEFAVGRASQKSLAGSFLALEPKGTKWHAFSWVGLVGNCLLMMFYTTVTGWMFAYVFKMIRGDFVGQTDSVIAGQFDVLKQDPLVMVGCMALVTVLGFLICSFGLKKGVERITKVMMVALLGIIVVLAVYVLTLPGAMEGVNYYLVPDFSKIFNENFGSVVFAALGQAFFTLSIGMGSMAIFGSYINKDRRLMGEATIIASLDTCVAFLAGLIIIPACFAFNVDQTGGPDLIFKVLPNVFSQMYGGQIWGTIFFVFLLFAAMSTVIAVFENILAFCMEKWNWSRKKACLICMGALIVLGLPCALGYNLLSGFAPFGANTAVLDLEDFIISNNILPLGSLVFVLFCTRNKKGWGWNNFLTEANLGKGLKTPNALRIYAKYVLPIILLALWVWGYVDMFFI